jgi:hypothetical protein
MRHADAELQLWLANDRISRERHDAELAGLARAASGGQTLRQRAGGVMIALGERLAGEGRPLTSGQRFAQRAF